MLYTQIISSSCWRWHGIHKWQEAVVYELSKWETDDGIKIEAQRLCNELHNFHGWVGSRDWISQLPAWGTIHFHSRVVTSSLGLSSVSEKIAFGLDKVGFGHWLSKQMSSEAQDVLSLQSS